jgi:hypothetical protein
MRVSVVNPANFLPPLALCFVLPTVGSEAVEFEVEFWMQRIQRVML